MSILIRTLGWTVYGIAVGGVLYTLLAVFISRRFLKVSLGGRHAGVGAADGVAILKPLHGAEPSLAPNLDGFFVQRSVGDTQIILGVQDRRDPALTVAQALCETYSNLDATVVIDPRVHGQNRKISNVINMMSQVKYPVLVLSDSDIAVGEDYLAGVRSALSRPGVGIVTCPYYGEGDGGLWSQLAAMGLSYTFLPNVLTGVSLGIAHPCMGSTLALRRETLERIGGFNAFRDVLADDYAIGAAVRRLGLQSVVAPVLVSHSCTEATYRALIAHELRWAKTVKGIDPLGHLGSLIAHPTPLALAAVLSLGVSPLTLWLLAAALASRFCLKAVVDLAIGRSLGSWWLLPMRDITSLMVFVGSFLARSVEWRGAKFHVTKDGDLKPV